MKILLISHMFPSSWNKVNGVFVHEQAKELIKMGHEVRVVSPIPKVPPFFKYISAKWANYHDAKYREIIDNIVVYYPRYIALPRNFHFHTSGFRMFLGIKQTLKEVYKEFNFDIIHAHVALPDGFAGMIAAKKYNKPLITTIHGQDFQHTIYKNFKCKNRILEVLEETEKTIVVSNKLNKIRKHIFPSLEDEKFIVIHNGVSDVFIEGQNEKKINSEIVLLSVSNLIKTKGIDLNIRAVSEVVKQFPKVRYNIIGEGPEKEDLTKLVKELDLENNVFFLGTKSRLEVKKFMAGADIFILPSWNEAFGVVYIEAMATGTPVIGCKGEGIEDIIKDGQEGYLVNPNSVSEIVKKVLLLIKNDKLRYKLGENARKKVIESFKWRNKASQLSQLYNSILNP